MLEKSGDVGEAIKPKPSYFEEVDEILGLEHNIRPTVTIGSSNPQSSKRLSPDEEEPNVEPNSKKRKVNKDPTKQSTKGSKLIDQLLNHLKENREERKRLEEKQAKQHKEKMELLKTIMGISSDESEG